MIDATAEPSMIDASKTMNTAATPSMIDVDALMDNWNGDATQSVHASIAAKVKADVNNSASLLDVPAEVSQALAAKLEQSLMSAGADSPREISAPKAKVGFKSFLVSPDNKKTLGDMYKPTSEVNTNELDASEIGARGRGDVKDHQRRRRVVAAPPKPSAELEAGVSESVAKSLS
jgi:hypothetical protein